MLGKISCVFLGALLWTVQFGAEAFANGQSTHLWISTQAIEALPDSELRALLTDPTFEQYWKNGTMFPDGGYAIGDDYGEIAHWEPFHIEYMNWIITEFSTSDSTLWSIEAKKHIAFLMGLASHGLADQSFDAMYFRRAYVYDADGMWNESLDTATDIAFIAQTGAQEVVDHWLPYDGLLSAYIGQGYAVDAATLDAGQARLRVAVYWVGGMASQPEQVSSFNAQFPWATSHLFDQEVPGNPSMEAEIVAAYWQILWKKLHQTSNIEPLLYVQPEDGSAGHPQAKDDIEASISFALSTGIDTTLLQPEHIWVANSLGEPHPIGIQVFYGMNSHIVNVTPLEDWDADIYTVHVAQGLPFINGENLEESLQWTFSTLPIEEIQEKSDNVKDSQHGCQNMPSTHFQMGRLFCISVFGIYGMIRGFCRRKIQIR